MNDSSRNGVSRRIAHPWNGRSFMAKLRNGRSRASQVLSTDPAGMFKSRSSTKRNVTISAKRKIFTGLVGPSQLSVAAENLADRRVRRAYTSVYTRRIRRLYTGGR
jgi:hypothetical protein